MSCYDVELFLGRWIGALRVEFNVRDAINDWTEAYIHCCLMSFNTHKL